MHDRRHGVGVGILKRGSERVCVYRVCAGSFRYKNNCRNCVLSTTFEKEKIQKLKGHIGKNQRDDRLLLVALLQLKQQK